MSEEKSWNWIERAFKKIPIQYPLVSMILFISSYLIFILLINQVGSFIDLRDWDIYIRTQIIATCLLVAYEMAGVQYFTYKVRDIFRGMEPITEFKEEFLDINNQIEERFTKSKIQSLMQNIFVILAVVSFYAVDLIRGKCPFFSMLEMNRWTILLDIFNIVITLVIFYSIITTLRIIYNIYWILNEGIKCHHRYIVKIDLFDVDKVGGLKPIRDLIIRLVVYQFIAISLAIISFITPNNNHYFEIIILVLLFLITTSFFVEGWILINRLLNEKREYDLIIINELIQQRNMQIIISGWNRSSNWKNLESILNSKIFLQDEREQLIRARKEIYNLKDIIIFIISLLQLIPFAAYVFY